jgi:hypothetical protein
MTTQHTTVFHCQSCGRLVYQPPGVPSPICCDAPMVCAIADLIRESPEMDASREHSSEPSGLAYSSEPVAL